MTDENMNTTTPAPEEEPVASVEPNQEPPSSFNPFIVTGCKCLNCDSPVEIKLPLRVYLGKKMIGEAVMRCTNPECRSIGTAGFSIIRCDFLQPKKGPVPIEE